MTITLSELLNALNNYFEDEGIVGDYTISESVFSNIPSSIQTDQYYKIEGSVFNDGIYQHGKETLKDETFTGVIYPMRVPSAITELLTNINTWITANGDQGMTGITAESFGGYSYSKAVGDNGLPATWRDVFSRELRRWKKI